MRSRSPTLCRLLFALQGIYLSLGMGHQSDVPPYGTKAARRAIHSYSHAKPTWSSPPKINKLNKQQKRMERLPLWQEETAQSSMTLSPALQVHARRIRPTR